MAKGHKPVSGSRAHWPRKRAKRIYASIKSYPQGKGILGFAGYKAGMTQVSAIDSRKGSTTQGREVFYPATVLAVPGLVVFGVKAYKRTPYGLRDAGILLADNISKDLARKLSVSKKPAKKELKGDEFRIVVHTKPRETGKKRPEVFEIPVDSIETAKGKLGQEIKASEVFKEGEWVDVRSVSKGKGFQGVVKRFGVTIRDRKAKKKRRHIGVLAPRNVARVRANTVAMAGQLGFQARTEYNKLILKIGDGGLTPKGGWLRFGELKGNFLILSGSVPGPKKRLVMLRKGLRAGPEQKMEVKEIVRDSQQ